MLFQGTGNTFGDSIPRPTPTIPKTQCNRCRKEGRAWIVKPIPKDDGQIVRQILDPDRAVYFVWYNHQGNTVGETAREFLPQLKALVLKDGTQIPIEHLAGVFAEHWATCPAVRDPNFRPPARERHYPKPGDPR